MFIANVDGRRCDRHRIDHKYHGVHTFGWNAVSIFVESDHCCGGVMLSFVVVHRCRVVASLRWTAIPFFGRMPICQFCIPLNCIFTKILLCRTHDTRFTYRWCNGIGSWLVVCCMAVFCFLSVLYIRYLFANYCCGTTLLSPVVFSSLGPGASRYKASYT